MKLFAFLRKNLAHLTRGTAVEIILQHGMEKTRGEWYHYTIIRIADSDSEAKHVISTPPVKDEALDQQHLDYICAMIFEDLEIDKTPAPCDPTAAQTALAKN